MVRVLLFIFDRFCKHRNCWSFVAHISIVNHVLHTSKFLAQLLQVWEMLRRILIFTTLLPPLEAGLVDIAVKALLISWKLQKYQNPLQFLDFFKSSASLYFQILIHRGWAQACYCHAINHIQACYWSREVYWRMYRRMPCIMPLVKSRHSALDCPRLRHLCHRSMGWNIQPSRLLWGPNSECWGPHLRRTSTSRGCQ